MILIDKTDPFLPKHEASQMLRGGHQDRLKRLLTVMSYRADIADGWEELISFAPKVNIQKVVYIFLTIYMFTVY